MKDNIAVAALDIAGMLYEDSSISVDESVPVITKALKSDCKSANDIPTQWEAELLVHGDETHGDVPKRLRLKYQSLHKALDSFF